MTVPSLSGMTCAQATTALQSAHFLSVCAPGTYNNNVPTQVLVLWSIGSTQNPTKAPYGATITLVPSLGHEPATVPSIPTSYTYNQAQAALTAVGLTATQNNESSATVPSGQVISTSPASGQQAPYGSAVAVNVSTGPPTTTVPNVIGDTVHAGHQRAAGGRAQRLGCVGQSQRHGERHAALGRLDGADRLVRPDLHPLARHPWRSRSIPTATSARRRACRNGTTRTTCAGWPTARCAACPWWCGSTTARRRRTSDVDHMVAQLTRVADARFGEGEWSVDRVMRQIPNHFHAHGRDPNWWFRLRGLR